LILLLLLSPFVFIVVVIIYGIHKENQERPIRIAAEKRDAEIYQPILTELGEQVALLRKSLPEAPAPSPVPETIRYPYLLYVVRPDSRYQQAIEERFRGGWPTVSNACLPQTVREGACPLYREDAKDGEERLGDFLESMAKEDYNQADKDFLDLSLTFRHSGVSSVLRNVQTIVLEVDDVAETKVYLSPGASAGITESTLRRRVFVFDRTNLKLIAFRSFEPDSPLPQEERFYHGTFPHSDMDIDHKSDNERKDWLCSLPSAKRVAEESK